MTSSTTVAISVGRAEAKTRSGMETTINPPRSRLIELLAGVSDLNADELREFADCSIGDVVCAISSTWRGRFLFSAEQPSPRLRFAKNSGHYIHDLRLIQSPLHFQCETLVDGCRRRSHSCFGRRGSRGVR